SDSEGVIYVGNAGWMLKNNIRVLPDEDAFESTRVFVAREGRLLGHIEIEDKVRPEAKRAVERLRAMNIDLQLLTGDTVPVAKRVARELGISAVQAELLPADKLERIKAIKANGRTVAMVGD